MKVRTHTGPEVIRIPKNIQSDIKEKGFHFYKWITPDEVKLSIERDFLSGIRIIGIPLAVIAVIAGLASGLNILVFLGAIIVGVFFLFLYLLILSLKRSFLLTKSAFIIITDSSISLGGKIHKLSELSQLQEDIDEVSETFEENLFESSRLSESKKGLGKQIMDQLFGGYKAIFSAGDNIRGKDSAQWILVIIALYTLYILVMISVYFVGVFFLLILGKIFVWANTQYLLKRGHSVMKINELFGDLDISSSNISSHKISLEQMLDEAEQNNWKDGLLLAINDSIEKINSDAQKATISVLALKNSITSSRYKEMFSFEIYNSWIKKQIRSPLEDILSLLSQNKKLLEETLSDIEKQIKGTKKVELQSALGLQKTRLEIQYEKIVSYIPLLENSISKLQ